MQYIKRRNIVGLEVLSRNLATDMITAGFTLVAVDGVAGTTITPDSHNFVFDAAVALDTLYTNQQWSVVLSADDDLKTISLNVVPKVQINGTTFKPSVRSATVESGRVAVDGLLANTFVDLVKDWKIDAAADFAAFPLSYDLIYTDHGFALHINAEALDNTGTAFSWAVVQRGVIAETGVVDPLSPLFCLFSVGGGLAGDPDTLKPEAVQRFTVIERDVAATSNVISAVQPSPDGIPVINPLQQVMIAEGNKAIILFPHMINSQRYMYYVVLDLIGYTSADVISAASEIQLTPASIETTYRAFNANGKDNRGMRVLFPIA